MRKSEDLHDLIFETRRILNRHLYRRFSVAMAVAELSRPAWLRSVESFDIEEWQRAAEHAWSRAKSLLGEVPAPKIILYPSFGRSNGRVYRLGERLVIACSPDFPHSHGDNLKVIVAHEYIHFARWQLTGMSTENHPVYRSLYEEGLATWLSHLLLPEQNLRTIFMCNLHRLIGLNDPAGGYLRWCRANLRKIAARASKHLNSRDHRQIHHLCEGGRFHGDHTPIRTGYYLGYRIVEMIADERDCRELFLLKPTTRTMEAWLGKLTESAKTKRVTFRPGRS